MNAAEAFARPDRHRRMLLRSIGWVLAIGLSAMLNLFLFGIMPGLVQRVPTAPDDLEEVRSIQVFRVKRPETPPRKKEKLKPPKPKETQKQVRQPAGIQKPVPAKIKPRFPFELNPKLPKFADSLEMPPLSHFSLGVQAPKGLYMPGELDGPLTTLSRVPPVYPLRASRLGIQGWVKVEFTVTKEGLVEDIRVLKAEPEGIFERTVMNCVSQWRFKPGTVTGIPVAARAETTLKFTLE